MELIAFITDFREIKKILRHIGEETQRVPPLSPANISVNEDSWYSDYIPPDDVYCRDEEYAF